MGERSEGGEWVKRLVAFNTPHLYVSKIVLYMKKP